LPDLFLHAIRYGSLARDGWRQHNIQLQAQNNFIHRQDIILRSAISLRLIATEAYALPSVSHCSKHPSSLFLLRKRAVTSIKTNLLSLVAILQVQNILLQFHNYAPSMHNR
jgi:hypothetical protein